MNASSRKALLVAGFLLAWVPVGHGGEIHDAAEKGDLRKVEALLAADASLVKQEGHDYTTPLHWAAIFNHKAVVELLPANKADVNARDKHNETPLHKAGQNGHGDVAAVLRRHGARQ
ncbi:MAG: ankyrin repeat domain-containing protein [Pseudomonadota bacterium]